MTGEYTTATLHFFEGGIFVECEDIDFGRFIPTGDAEALVKAIAEIDTDTNPDTVYTLVDVDNNNNEKTI